MGLGVHEIDAHVVGSHADNVELDKLQVLEMAVIGNVSSLVGKRLKCLTVALTPIRRIITEQLKNDTIGDYVTKAKDDDVPFKDIMLVREPVSCWILKIADHLVVLPLRGDSPTSQSLQELQRLSGGQLLSVEGIWWSFTPFGTLGTVPVHLAGADTAN